MDVSMGTRVKELLDKYKFVALVILLGVGLMLFPGKAKAPSESPGQTLPVDPENSVEDELSALLSQIEGAGKVRLMLSTATGAQTVYQTDTDRSQNGEALTEHSDTVVFKGESAQEGLVQRTDPPIYKGAVILCQGADRPAVKLAIVEAVSKYTGLRADQIAVLKMK